MSLFAQPLLARVALAVCGQAGPQPGIELRGRLQRDAPDVQRPEIGDQQFGGFLAVDLATRSQRAPLPADGVEQVFFGGIGDGFV